MCELHRDAKPVTIDVVLFLYKIAINTLTDFLLNLVSQFHLVSYFLLLYLLLYYHS